MVEIVIGAPVSDLITSLSWQDLGKQFRRLRLFMWDYYINQFWNYVIGLEFVY